MTKNLQMSLKTKWFEMTKSGEKPEDYREINSYWVTRLFNKNYKDFFNCNAADMAEILKFSVSPNGYIRRYSKQFNQNTMTLGYPSKDDKERIIQFEHAGIEIREGRPEWGAEPGKIYFVIKHGKRL